MGGAVPGEEGVKCVCEVQSMRRQTHRLLDWKRPVGVQRLVNTQPEERDRMEMQGRKLAT